MNSRQLDKVSKRTSCFSDLTPSEQLWLLTRWPRGQELVQDSLSRRQDLLRQLGDQVLGELLQLVPLQAGQGLADRRPQLHARGLEKGDFVLRFVLKLIE